MSAVLLLHCPAGAASNDNPCRILFLNSYHRGYSWSDGIEEGLRQGFKDSKKKIDLYVEFLDTKRFPDLQHLTGVAEVLADKCSRIPYDVIVVSDNNGFDFARRYRDRLFPDIPMVFCGYNSFRPEVLKGMNHVTGVNEEVDFRKTIDMALAVQPDADTLVFITSDYYASGKRNQDRVEKSIIPVYSGRYRITPLKNLYMSQLEEQLPNLPSGSIVFVFGAPLDNSKGKFIETPKYYRRVAEASAVPVYSFWDFTIGTGLMGGDIITGQDQGRIAAQLTLKVLNDIPTDRIPPVIKSPTSRIFDYNAMKRFGISMGSLPADNIVINVPDTFYDRYGRYIWIAAGLFFVLSILVIFLAGLSRRLNVARHNLESLNADLENQVAERTKTLRRTNQSLKAEILERMEAEQEQERLIGELKQALGKVRQLEGILPTCSFCKKIRDENGQWKEMEAYIQDRSHAKFSHGFCPNCGRKHYPEFMDDPAAESSAHKNDEKA